MAERTLAEARGGRGSDSSARATGSAGAVPLAELHLQGFEADLADPASQDAARIRAAGARLVRAWRGLWAHYGDSAAGAGESYRAALQAFLDELPDSAMASRLRNGTPWFNAVASAALRPAVRAGVD